MPPRKAIAEGYATREEFEEFKRSIGDALRAFLDFFASLGTNLKGRGARRSVEDVRQRFRETPDPEESEFLESSWQPRSEKFFPEESDDYQRGRWQTMAKNIKQRFREMLASEGEPPKNSRQSRGKRYYSDEYDDLPQGPRGAGSKRTFLEDDKEPPNKGNGHSMYAALWIPAIALFGFGDTLLSTMVFTKGGYEANPLMGSLISMFGGSLVAFVMIKTVILIALAVISFKMFKHHGWLIPSILCVVGTFLVFSNLMTYIGL